MMEYAVSLRDAVFWLNIYRQLLAANQQALERLRELATVSHRRPSDYEPDFNLLLGEAGRLLDRILYWEGMVDTARRASRVRPGRRRASD
jgi:hypothetical protein